MKDTNGSPQQLKVQNNCGDCSFRDASYFCNLSKSSLSHFQAIKVTNTHPKGASLFTEGQPTDGIFVLCRGSVKLTTHSRNGKSLILRVALPGEVLGLSATITATVSESTAKVIEPCQVNFVHLSEFRQFLDQNADAGVNALHQLSLEYKKAYMQIRWLGLSACTADKLATLLLEWSKSETAENGAVHLHNRFSHEEIAEMLGTSRETVTRLFKEFRSRDLISISGPNIFIPNIRRLEQTLRS